MAMDDEGWCIGRWPDLDTSWELIDLCLEAWVSVSNVEKTLNTLRDLRSHSWCSQSHQRLHIQLNDNMHII